jgi:acyl-coenzyme A synthetase/AMP-(fatty) acid ligase
MTTVYPLTRHDRLDAIFAVTATGPVTVEKFLQDVAGLAALLPPHRYVFNLCNDRYRFTVALAAALTRGQISLMPPSDTAGVLGGIAAGFSDLYAIHDGTAPAIDLPTLAYPDQFAGPPQPATMPSFPDSQPAVTLFTSGSTGKPTPHLKSWGILVRSSIAAGNGLGVQRIPGAAIIGTVPQQHSYGIESTVMLALQHGLVLHYARPFYPADVFACIDTASAPRILITTPIHLRALLAETGRLPAPDLIVSATAPLSPQLAIEAERRFNAPLLEIYGCSEAGQLAVRRTVESDEWQCIDGAVLSQDSTGTWASGTAVEGDVLLNDVIELYSPSRFHLHGRLADLVNIAGKRTSLAHLNYHLNSIDGVRDGVFVMPDENDDSTTRLMAFAVAPDLNPETVLAALRDRIDPAFLPRPLRLVDSLPRNVLGKLSRDAVDRLVDGKTS